LFKTYTNLDIFSINITSYFINLLTYPFLVIIASTGSA
jgi:hypothetical protein